MNVEKVTIDTQNQGLWRTDIWTETVWFVVQSWWDTGENFLTLALIYTDIVIQSVRWQVVVYSDSIDFNMN